MANNAPGGIPATTTPTILNNTSTTVLTASSPRAYLCIQNNSSGDIMFSLSGAALTGIAPSATNIGEVLTPGASWENPSHYCPNGAVTVYQSSGGTINTIAITVG